MVKPMATIIPILMTEHASQSALIKLLAFLSPAFPIGGFSYSHGLEKLVEDGTVHDPQSLQDWIEGILNYGAGRNDGILLKESFNATSAGDVGAVKELIELGLALQPSRERHLEASAQGTAFIQTVAAAWAPGEETPALDILAQLTDEASDTCVKSWPLPVAIGTASACHGISRHAVLAASLQAFVSNLISAAIRLVPLGQTDGQKVLARLEPVILKTAATIETLSLDDLGSATFLTDIASMDHETQYTRLFRS
ncbi:urease accessory protein UreF [Roseibium sp. RKSG952]|nr:urease accessory protein UreF [Roseibium sp. RKSG952]MTI01067.1 urease accessory protein UreF [Roseibium sp. RKSG952]